MNNLQSHTFMPIGPYDSTIEDHLTMYDSLPYARDISLRGSDVIALKSGNIIKYYRCAKKEPFMVSNHDVAFTKGTNKLKQKEANEIAAMQKRLEELPDDLTEEQMNELLKEMNQSKDASFRGLV